MNLEVRTLKTSAETALAEQFAALKGTLPGGETVAALRERAFHRIDGPHHPGAEAARGA